MLNPAIDSPTGERQKRWTECMRAAMDAETDEEMTYWLEMAGRQRLARHNPVDPPRRRGKHARIDDLPAIIPQHLKLPLQRSNAALQRHQLKL